MTTTTTPTTPMTPTTTTTSTTPTRAARTRLGILLAAAALLFGLTPAAAAPGPDEAPPDVPLRVATYNIHAGAGQDNVFDLDRTAATLAALDADVIGLQEADVHWGARSQWRDLVTELADRLGMRAAFAPIYDFDPLTPGAPRRQYGLALLSAHPIISVENHDLTRLSTQEPNPVPRPQPGFLEAVVEVDGAWTHVYVTHLDYRSDPSVRRAQVADTLAILAADRPGANQLLIGDFNAPPEAAELAPLWPVLTDAWTAAPVTTGQPLTYPAFGPVKRIDYVTVSAGVRVLAAHVPDDPALLAASDHRPVVADLALNRGWRPAS